MTAITDENVQAFSRYGFLIVERILDDDQRQTLLAAMDRVYRGEYNADIRPPPLRKPLQPMGNDASVRWLLNTRVLDKELWRVMTDARLGQMAAALLRTPSVSLVEDQLLDKPGPSVPVNVHQDYSYWPFSRSTNMVTAWIALVDMVAELGPVECLPGSHLWGPTERPRDLIVGSEEGYLAGVTPAAPPGSRLEFTPVIVPAGGGVFFHSLTFHGSGRNTTTRPRRACSLHWASAECTVDRGKLTNYDYPYFFAGLKEGGPLVNKYMPRVYSRPENT